MTKEYITDLLSLHAQVLPDKLAIIEPKRSLTWAELHSEVQNVAAQLAPQLPVGEQGVVGLLLPNSWQFVVAYLAVIEAGHIALPLDPGYKSLEIDSIVDQIPPDRIITSAELSGVFSPDHPVILFDDLLQDKPVPAAQTYFRLPPREQVVSLLFTSGTTGKPKATPYTHANHIWNITAVSELWKWNADDTILISLPLSHWHALVMGLTGALYHGNTLYLQERFDAEDTLAMLESGKISLFMHVPIAYWKLVHHTTNKQYDLTGKVRICISGSSYLPPAVWHGFKERFGQEILERYGSSETGLIASNPLDERLPGSVGFVLPDVSIQSQPDGELIMKSPGLFPGYYHNPEATKTKFVQGDWWLTGDIGEFTAGERLALKGRIQEKIKKFAYTVYPRDVEWALLKNPDVKDVVVMGIQEPDSLNDTMIYFVVSSLSEAEIQAYCKKNMQIAWRPDRIVILDDIPKTRSGKPQLPRLKQML